MREFWPFVSSSLREILLSIFLLKLLKDQIPPSHILLRLYGYITVEVVNFWPQGSVHDFGDVGHEKRYPNDVKGS